MSDLVSTGLALLTRLASSTVFQRVVDWSPPPGRADYVMVGGRGSGKTAAAVSLGESWVGRQHIAVGAPASFCRARPAWESWSIERLANSGVPAGAVVLADESRLSVGGAEASGLWWHWLALARHRDNCFLLTAQSTAAVPPDVWRQDVVPVFLRSRGAAGWLRMCPRDDDSLVRVEDQAQELLCRWPDWRGAVPLARNVWGRWAIPLAAGWTEEQSKLWSAPDSLSSAR